MLNCPRCHRQILSQDLAVGVCARCGTSLTQAAPSVLATLQLSQGSVSHNAIAEESDKTIVDYESSSESSQTFQMPDEQISEESRTIVIPDETKTIQMDDDGSIVDSAEVGDGGYSKTLLTDEDSSTHTSDVGRDMTASRTSAGASGTKSSVSGRGATQPKASVGSKSDTSDTTSGDTANQSLVIKTRLLVDSAELAVDIDHKIQPEYELISVLGVGGMGIVYDARQTSIDRNVALKMIKGEAAQNDKRNAKFLAEAVVTGDLDHPNIVPIYDVGTNSKGQLFYSMKKVQGTPWLKVIAKKSLSENLDILMRTADAVGFAHARGIVHRDLKPENIMLGEFGEVLVMDWGLAHPLGGYRKSRSISSSKSMGGTPAYMAPEMATGPIEKIGPASDIYLLGAILYEIVTGHPPHIEKTAMKCLVAAASNVIAPTEKTGELVDIALKAMATEVTDRYQTVKEMQLAIREYQSHLESVLLSTHADEDLKDAKEKDDYQKYSRALFGYQEAYELWSGNKRAAGGISVARLAYAESAKRKGDYDLGLSLLNQTDPEHVSLWHELVAAQAERVARQKRLTRLKRLAIGLVASVLVIATGSAIWIRAEQQKAVAEAIRATNAEKVALAEKSKAMVAAEQEKKAKVQAIAAEKVAVAHQLKAEEAQKLEEKAKNAAIAAEEVAVVERTKAEAAKLQEEYEAYISKIGLAASLIDKNAFDVARTTLSTCKPELRNWEWGRLMHLCSQSIRAFDAHSPLESLAVDHDGKRFATGGWDGTALIWDRETGRVLHSLKHGGEYVNSVAISPDGRFLATGGNDREGFIQIWEIASGKRLKVIKGHDDEVLSVSYSKDGSRLLTSSYDKTARMWDIETGHEIRKFSGHTWWVWSAAFSADERRVITAGHDGTSIVWDVATEKRSPAFTGHHGPVFCAVFSPDGKHAVSAGYDRRILVWKPEEIRPVDFKNLTDGATVANAPVRAFDGHADAVRSIAFSADGSLLLSGSFDNTVRVWVFDTNQPLKTFRGHGGRVKAVSFASGSQFVLSAAHDNTVREWSIPGYEEIRTLQGRVLEGHSDAVLAATYSRDQQQIVTASRDRTARTWNAKTGEAGLTLAEGHSFLASSAIFFPNGRRLLTAAVDNTARIWDVSTGGQLLRLDRSGRSAAAAISHDAKLIATGADDKSAQIWDASTGIRLKKLEAHNTEVTSVAFSIDDRLLATGDTKGHVKLWDVADGQVVASLDGHTRRISSLIFLADGSRLLTASSDNTVGQWNVASKREIPDLILKHPDSILTMHAVPGGNSVVTSCADGLIRIWNTDSAKVIRTLGPFGREVFSISVSVDGKRLLAANSDERTVRLWDLETGSEIRSPQPGGTLGPLVDLKRRGGLLWSTAFLPGTDDVLTVGGSDVRLWDAKSGREKMSFSPHGAVASAQFSPEGDLVVTGSWDNTAKIWDARTGHSIRKLENGHTSLINTAVFSPDGNFILTASDDGTAKLWDVESGTVVRALEGHGDRVRSGMFSPNGDYIVTTSSDKTARLWNAKSGELIREFKGHEWAVVCVDFSKDGRWIVTGSEDNTARVWNVETAEQLLTLSGHTASVTSVNFSPDSMRIITGGQDQAAKLWDAKTGKEILTLSRHTEEVTSVAFSPDGHQILTGSRDGTAVIWLSRNWNDTPSVAAGGSSQ
ncbi:WD40 domain-containing protein [Schlesneria paludicola]|uniref:WD40 domain-containing protein n=1 Tax=Schlesneria paludicola TaxID=360056 RepID=UPI00029ADDA4|nr:protein kinase [Schlesneria paludicola]